MIKFLIIVPVVYVLIIALLGAYLSPDDLRKCDEQPSSKNGCQKVDAIIAVSGGMTPVRTAEAIKLYQDGWANYLVLAGAARDAESPSNAAVMRQQALEAGVPDSAIFIEEDSRTTHQNAEYVERIVQQKDIQSMIVVTSPYHQRRAGLEFQQRLGQEVNVLNHPVNDDPDWPWYWWITPRGLWLAAGEVVKIGATHAGGSQ